MSAAVRPVGFILLGLVTVLFFLCQTLLRRTSHRRTAYFSLVRVFYMFSSRIFASALGIKLSHYVPLERLGMGALLVADAPLSAPKYRWLAAICYA